MKKNIGLRSLTDTKVKQMKETRITLLKTFHTVRVLAEKNISYRDPNDDGSKFITFF